MVYTWYISCLLGLGVWNAKVGKASQKTTHMGTFGLGDQNTSGGKLLEFCKSNDLVIGNTIFPHHPRRLYTWRSPDERTRNQIDYIMIKSRWRASLLNVKTRPDADCGSDHQLLIVKARIKLKATRNRKRQLGTMYRTYQQLSS